MRGQKGEVLCGNRVKDVTFVGIRRVDQGWLKAERKAITQLFCHMPSQLGQVTAMVKESIHRGGRTSCVWVGAWMQKTNVRKGVHGSCDHQ